MKNAFESRANRAMARINQLGFTKAGKPMVIDQAREVVAAEEGARNWHVLSSQEKNATNAVATDRAPASADKEALASLSKILNGLLSDAKELSNNKREDLGDYSESDLADWDRRLAIAEMFVGRINGDACLAQLAQSCEKAVDLDPLDDDKEFGRDAAGLPPESDYGLSPRRLSFKHGQEHPTFLRAVWQEDVSCGDTRLGYWDWVQHNVDSHYGEVCDDISCLEHNCDKFFLSDVGFVCKHCYQRDALEQVGYDFSENSESLYPWTWSTPSDGSEVDFKTPDEAIENAWNDASSQVIRIREISESDWYGMHLTTQSALMVETLGG